MFHSILKAFWCEEDGQDLVEYSLLLAFIALAAIAVLTTVKANITLLWNRVNARLTTATGSF